jgi:hypothetical protein
MGRRGRGGDDEELMELPELPEGEEEEDLEDEDFSAGSDTDEEGGGKSKKAKKKGKKEKAKPKEKQSKKRRNEFVDDVADEDDDEEEEEVSRLQLIECVLAPGFQINPDRLCCQTFKLWLHQRLTGVWRAEALYCGSKAQPCNTRPIAILMQCLLVRTQEEGRGRKRKKRGNVFIDDIADVDDDEEEEEDDVSGAELTVGHQHPAAMPLHSL